MRIQETPTFSFKRKGSSIICFFNNHPLKGAEGKKQWMGFTRNCESELEAELLLDFLNGFHHEMVKHYFTEGYNTKKRKEVNYYLR